MATRITWTCIILAFLGLGPILGFAWLNQLGGFAKSPQRIELSVGSSTLVAGGKAKIWFSSVEMGPMVEVTCKGTQTMLELTDEPSEEVCGVRIRKVDVYEKQLMGRPMLKGVFEVTWDEAR